MNKIIPTVFSYRVLDSDKYLRYIELYYKEYLERAKQALIEAGGTYTPSQAELCA
mgnify:FL=1